ncbi:hypothetical protein JOF53_005228 [Crossiella equi]|uniref:Uncharacterized protein n=1 Tax=Crossiella equi TaxID=130796 RepID=A0ABS5AIH8_9PSEU|nr:hypothetical protein [Crossiella equi]MBP2476356.1 hypothetical protein [Crossiella equi]
MKLAVHLFSTDALSFGDAVRVPAPDEPETFCLLPRTEHEVPFVLAARRGEDEAGPEHEPPAELGEHFELEGVLAGDSALLAEVDGRLFALTFGRGEALLEASLFEEGFEGKAIPFPLAGLGPQLVALLGHYDDPLCRANSAFSADRV